MININVLDLFYNLLKNFQSFKSGIFYRVVFPLHPGNFSCPLNCVNSMEDSVMCIKNMVTDVFNQYNTKSPNLGLSSLGLGTVHIWKQSSLHKSVRKVLVRSKEAKKILLKFYTCAHQCSTTPAADWVRC